MKKGKQCLVTIVVVLWIFYQVNCTDLTYTIPEEQPVNTVIGHILNDTANLQGVIKDKDVPHLKFTFLSEGNAITSLFALDSQTGRLAVGADSTLDSETICPFHEKCHIKLDVVVQSPLNDLFRKVSILVILEDINDNPPTFPNPAITVDVSEAVLVGASIPLEGASDRDMGNNNSLQSYEIEPSNEVFGLSFRKNLDGTSYLNLVVQGELDHEKVSSYSLRVVAKDGGEPQLQGVMKVNVTITDVNDNVPKFKKDQYSVSVDENVSPNSVIVQVQAVDRDSGENGQISYKLSSHQDQKITTLFKIDPVSGNISVQSDLQSEATEVYNIIVEAIDHALQPFTSQTIVTVTVRDVINSPPKLTVNMLSGATISEYANIGAAVAHVAVKESDRGRNGIVSCDLKNTTYFNLQGFDIDEYKVIVAKPLDAELLTNVNIDIVCEDAGSPPLSATHTFEMTVTDENDNSPIFVKPLYTGSISENSREGQSIVTVRASDEDSGLNGQVKYSLGSDATDNFRISQDTGVIRSNVSFDYETQKFANFTVVAYDQGTPTRSASTIISIKIKDINDEAPKFPQEQFTVEVSENAKPGEIVSVIKAFDFESGQNGELMYFLLNKTPSIPFTMFVNGSLVLDEALDYEKKQTYKFKIMVVDKGEPPLNTTTTVVIKVQDENDNKPIIAFPNVPKYLVNVTFSDKKDTVITRLRVIDLDSGLNGQLRYVITSRNDSGRFEINAETGELFTTKSYDFEDIDLYRLVITVTDNGSPPFADHTAVFIKLSQGNGTAASAGASNEQNILITLTIVCVTIIVSATIVLVIVIMRRRDRRKQSSLRNHHLGNNDPTKYDSILKSNNINDRKESMMDETNSDYSLSHDKMAALKNKDNFDLNPKSTNLHRNTNISTNSLNSLKDSSDVGDRKNLDHIKAMQIHQVLLENYKQIKGVVHMPRRDHVLDDVHSDASLETTTSDSGRGGSEEDVCSHNGEHDATKNANCSFQSHGTLSNQNFPSHSQDSFRNSGRKQVRFGNSVTRKLHPSEDILELRNSYDKPHHQQRKPQVLHATNSNDNAHHWRPRYGGQSSEQDLRHKSVPFQQYPTSSTLNDDDSGHYIPMGFTKLSNNVSKNNLHRPRERRPASFLSVTTDDGDDRSTTTSGSYTIDADDRFASLDYPQFQDVVV